MAIITIRNLFHRTIEVNPQKSLLKHFHDNRLDWMHACGGKGRCTTCKVIIINGAENISPLTPAELRYQDMKALNAGERLSCQARPMGDITVLVPEEYMLPHISYGE
jgi:ferredoxin, 2Fe-2S